MKRKRRPDDRVKGRGRCPRCGCRRTGTVEHRVIAGFYARTLEVCANCAAAWEPLPPGTDRHSDHRDDDGSPFPFPEPCDNCAFRPGSPEQRDPAQWRALMDQLKAGARFYCHKGVPIDPEGEDGFAYPRGADGRPAERKLRLCRGFLNAWKTWMDRQYPADDGGAP